MSDRLSTKAGVFESGEKDVMGVQYKDGRVISCRNSKLEDYTVAEGTEVICDRAFMNLKDLRSIKLPDTLRAIGESAFSGCKALTDINIPDGVTEIRQATFRDCDALAAIELPASVTVIEKFAFGRGLTTLVVNAPEMSIDKYAFMNARDFSTLIVPEGRADYYRRLLADIRVKAEVEESEAEDNEPQSMLDRFASASADEANEMTKGLFKSNNMEEEKKTKTVTVEVFGKELFLEPKDPDEEEPEEDAQSDNEKLNNPANRDIEYIKTLEIYSKEEDPYDEEEEGAYYENWFKIGENYSDEQIQSAIDSIDEEEEGDYFWHNLIVNLGEIDWAGIFENVTHVEITDSNNNVIFEEDCDFR